MKINSVPLQNLSDAVKQEYSTKKLAIALFQQIDWLKIRL